MSNKIQELINRLKNDNYRKQMLATRLLVQRNNEKFNNYKIKNALKKLLEQVRCQPGENSNIFEIIQIISERVHESWQNYDKVLVKNNELLKETNSQREEIVYLTNELKQNCNESELEMPIYMEMPNNQSHEAQLGMSGFSRDGGKPYPNPYQPQRKKKGYPDYQADTLSQALNQADMLNNLNINSSPRKKPLISELKRKK